MNSAPEQSASPAEFEYKQGETIIREGETGQEIFQLREGRAEVKKHNVKLGELNAGDIFGVVAALTDNVRSASVVAITSCRIERISTSNAEQFILERPDVTLKILKDMAGALAKLDEKFSSLESDPLVRAVMRTLR